MVQASGSTDRTKQVSISPDVIEMETNPSSAAREGVKAAQSNLSSKALGKQAKTAASGPLPTQYVAAMAPAAVPARVHPANIPKKIVNHFFPPPPENVGEILTSYEEAIRTVRESRPVDEAKYEAFQTKRLEALELESKAALMSRQLAMLEDIQQHADAALNVENLPDNVAKLISDTVATLPHAERKGVVAEMKKSVEQAWKAVDTAWDKALVDYLDAHQLKRPELEKGFARAGSPAYASRVIAPALLSAATAIPSFIHASTPEGRLGVTGASALTTLLIASLIHPLTYAGTTLTSVTWSDRLFDHAADIQDLLGTKMIDEVDKQLQAKQGKANEALQGWNAVKGGDDVHAKETALQGLQDAVKDLEAANHEYLMRADLNRVYIQGFGIQGLNNGAKYYGNVALGPLAAVLGSTAGASIQLGIAGAQFASHMAVSPYDEKNKQLRMFYLRMRASAPRPGETREETLQRFGKEIRDPFKVAEGALQQIFTARVGKLDTDIADTLKIKPNEWQMVVKLNEFEEAGGEPGVFEGDLEAALAVRARIQTTKNALPAKDQEKLEKKISERNDTAQDIRHVAASEFSKVSKLNQGEVYQGLQITPPSSGILEGLKNFFAGPFSPEFLIGMKQGKARMELPQEVMTTYGMSYWAAFQLGICGENGPLILSKLAQLCLAGAAYGMTKESPSDKATIALQSTLAGINLLVTGVLIYSSYQLLSIVLHPKMKREKYGPLAGGRSAEANTTYLASLLKDREPHRAERTRDDADAGLQRTGMGAGFSKELGKTIVRRLTVLARESIPAGKARDHFLESVGTLDTIKKEIERQNPELAEQMHKESEALLDNAEMMHGAIQEISESSAPPPLEALSLEEQEDRPKQPSGPPSPTDDK
ncbi:hypothetical protein Hsero_0821 [Herbaspirillum seropedicae SmR1]|uniref:Uncharacterized protein n=3 Tax=Herbaspirillum seropedicae TaxID=964 RepID=D8J003_HERSS|nr:hypothetical protein Hsero_0821 [Herbaspirillum seropedicae SmR1]